jgi:Fe-S cluster biogenesis protein NfuA
VTDKTMPDDQSAMRMSELTRALDGLLPAMIVDGGGARIESADESGVVVRLIGSCTFCQSRRKSAEALDRALRARVPALGRLRIVTESGRGREEVIATLDRASACG